MLQKLDSVIASPFAEDMKETTAEVLLWTQKHSGIEVMDLELFVNSIKSRTRELAPFLLRAYFFGKVQHVLDNKVAEDQPSAKVAGLENLVHVYREYLKEHPSAANSETDKLAGLKAANELGDYIRGIENRDGLSYKTAIIPKSIIAEYQWMKEHYPNAQLLGKELIQHEGKTMFLNCKTGREKNLNCTSTPRSSCDQKGLPEMSFFDLLPKKV